MKTRFASIPLSAYSAIALSFGLNEKADAQIVYQDIDPDELFSQFTDDSFLIDFDDNGTNDVTIMQDLWKLVSLFSSSYGFSTDGWVDHELSVMAYDVMNTIPGSFVDYAHGASPLEMGELISFDGLWNNSGFARLWHGEGEYSNWYNEYGSGSYTDFNHNDGQWYNKDHRYLGVQFLIDGEVHFGWVQITTDSTYKIYQKVFIESFAYEATPGAPIFAGMLPGCFPPIPIGAAAITGTTAKLKWASMDSVDHYELQYRMIGVAGWTTKIVAGIKSFRKVAGLNCDSDYEWRIRTICDDGELSLYSEIQSFSTASCRLGEIATEDEETISIFSSGNTVHIWFEEEPFEPVNCTIYDMMGNAVLMKSVEQTLNEITTSLPVGIYVVQLYNNNFSFAQQVIIQ